MNKINFCKKYVRLSFNEFYQLRIKWNVGNYYIVGAEVCVSTQIIVHSNCRLIILLAPLSIRSEEPEATRELWEEEISTFINSNTAKNISEFINTIINKVYSFVSTDVHKMYQSSRFFQTDPT